jgi:hypothetical protein
VLLNKDCQFESLLFKVGDDVTSHSPAGPNIGLSHNGAEAIDPIITEQAKLVQGIIARGRGDIFCGLLLEATDFHKEQFNPGPHFQRLGPAGRPFMPW